VSSPSTPQNPPKPHQPNHIIHLKSWHSSYAPLATINIWIKSIEGQLIPRGNKLPPPARTALSQPNKPHRINLLPATNMGRHSGAARISVVAFVCFSPSFWHRQNLRIGLGLFVILSEAQNLCRCLCCAAAPTGNQL
jgi:hypothetical protein